MTLAEAIARLDTLKPNAFTDTEKRRWLTTLDGRIKNEILDMHEGGEAILAPVYDENADPMTVLLVPPPYDEVYLRYLEMQVDYANEDYTKYNNSSVLFNEAYTAFERHYNRRVLPIGKAFRFF
ncbi:MAG: hypothetical protein IJV98_02070 [Clostridia bacterium]|nr:hypothetical protein [Clostridia bacterium]